MRDGIYERPPRCRIIGIAKWIQLNSNEQHDSNQQNDETWIPPHGPVRLRRARRQTVEASSFRARHAEKSVLSSKDNSRVVHWAQLFAHLLPSRCVWNTSTECMYVAQVISKFRMPYKVCFLWSQHLTLLPCMWLPAQSITLGRRDTHPNPKFLQASDRSYTSRGILASSACCWMFPLYWVWATWIRNSDILSRIWTIYLSLGWKLENRKLNLFPWLLIGEVEWACIVE